MRVLLALLLTLTWFAAGPAALAQQAVIAVVNDHPVTDFDIDERIKLLQILGDRDPARLARKVVGNAIINDYVKIEEAKLSRITITDDMVSKRLDELATNMKTNRNGLISKLQAEGVSEATMRLYMKSQMSFGALLQVKYRDKVEVTPGDIDRKMAAIKADIQKKVDVAEADPRRRPVRVIELQEINFPAETADPAVLNSRAAEAAQVMQKIKSCDNLRSAASGIFNVQIGKKIEADASKLPDAIRNAFLKVGEGRAVGPMRYPKGMQLLAWCGSRTINPPPIKVSLPDRKLVENAAMNEKFVQVEAKYVALMRKNAIIEYKDQSYAQ